MAISPKPDRDCQGSGKGTVTWVVGKAILVPSAETRGTDTMQSAWRGARTSD